MPYKRQDVYPGLVTELGNLQGNAKGGTQWDRPRGLKPMCRAGTDCLVVVLKRL
ncbi:MAG: hypothetical protein AB7D40_11660 [Bacteroidales bacterium]